jgi:hypothetical protein
MFWPRDKVWYEASIKQDRNNKTHREKETENNATGKSQKAHGQQQQLSRTKIAGKTKRHTTTSSSPTIKPSNPRDSMSIHKANTDFLPPYQQTTSKTTI